ncbi:MutL C terminal dimerization domain protein [Cryptosporidium hominis]|uniref:PMS1/MutL family ATpase n=3 Tax=Cryptosporidium hominis TaxID=237895 RepID=A0ABX5BFC7_CRYHO|nr:Mismatch repair endonuclease PMS2 [Cryptosporidium hominis]PPA63657.1 MutL C terminal dimerization domain protein [Cryptosporidium hominis]PPS96651.1 PMS1/MutL family ATpase [Cryptosporidium hominis]|eukprot:PPS96651.1 PMS1/MutL family ATpase [Cryptosporidium hominis]
MLKKLSKEDQDRICSQQVITELQDCIKELVDNAIDAGCTEILISLTDFGSSTIEVLDNGKGIEDLNKIGERGVTSKLENFDNIHEDLSTLGFRGEGLNSIINSSEIVEIDTKYDNKENKIVFEKGKCLIEELIIENKNQNSDKFHKYHFSSKSGTRIRVIGLFLPYISRRTQFLRNIRLQLKSLIVLIEEYAICYPMIRFLLSNRTLSDTEREKIHKRLLIGESSEIKYQSNQIQSELIMTRGKVSSQKEVAQYIWGKSVLGNSLDFKLEGEVFVPKLQNMDSKIQDESLVGGKWIISGFISSLDKGRPSPDHQIFTVNNRPVNPIKRISRVISSIHSTLSSFNNRKLYPAFVINIYLPQSLLDINVTPNKRIVMLPAKVETVLAENIQQFLQDSYQNNIPIKREEFIENRYQSSILNYSSTSQDHCSTEISQSQISSSQKPKDKVVLSYNHLTDNLSNSGKALELVLSESSRLGEKKINEDEKNNNESENKDEIGNTSFSESKMESIELSHQTIGTKRHRSDEVSLREFYPNDFLTNQEKDSNIRKIVLPSFNENMDEGMDVDMDENKDKSKTKDKNKEKDMDKGKVVLNQVVPRNLTKIRLKNCIPVESIMELRYNKAEQEGIWNNRKGVCIHFGGRFNKKKVNRDEKKFLPNEDITQIIHKNESGVSELKNTENDQNSNRCFNFKKHLFNQLQVIGQFNKGFILTKLSIKEEQNYINHKNNERNGKNMIESLHIFIIDQHASDEKARFEKLNSDLSNIQTQKLISPLSISLTPSQEQLVISYKDIFEQNGFRFIFNSNSEIGSRIQLTQLPVILGIPLKQIDFLDLLSQINKYKVRVSIIDDSKSKVLDLPTQISSNISVECRQNKRLMEKRTNEELDEKEEEEEKEDSISVSTGDQENTNVTLWCPSGIVPRPRRIWSILASKACRSAVMIGDDLNLPKMKSIVKTMSTLKSPWNCPHGRPSIRHLGHFSAL